MFVGFERSVCTNSSGVFICISGAHVSAGVGFGVGRALSKPHTLAWRDSQYVRSERLTEGIFRRRRTTRGESAARHRLLPRARLQELHLPEESDARRAGVSDRHVGN